MKLLIAKDNGGATIVGKAALDVGFEQGDVTITRSSDAARAALSELIAGGTPPDVAVIDPHLDPNAPGREDGLEFVVELKRLCRDCYVICLTKGFREPDIERRAQECGADVFVSTKDRGNWIQNVRNALTTAMECVRQQRGKSSGAQ